ncbi:MAG: beta-ketoacyl-ACP synthase II [Verrucomicrobia bacterium]|jgi:3-oxoacyl-[acyl-carrier-protein] synthase II|nr:beta-ketoacyl-ACP synthase II [Verrucomicrobiota bacterium]
MERKRIVVTGMGAITPLGNSVAAFREALFAGKSGITGITHFDPADYPCKVGGEVKDFVPGDWMDPKEAKRNDRYTQLAVAASRMAMDDAGLNGGIPGDPTRFGCILGSGIGGLDTIEKQTFRLWGSGPRKVSPFMIPMLISNMASGVVAIEFGAKGPNYGIVSACATAAHAIGDCLRILRAGEADIMLAGGSEASITRIGYAGFCNMKAMGTNFNEEPEKASRPFDARRDGFIMGEGAGILVLETLEHAHARGAQILCEVAGHAASCDAYHITSPDPEGVGLQACMRNSLKDAGIKEAEVDYINAHGTSTPYNDKTESAAIKEVFGEHAEELAISSTKSMTGHLLGAAGGIEAIACIETIRHGIVPPTINYEFPDPECDLEYVPNKAVAREVKVALSNNLGFGGHNATLVFRRFS